MTGKSSNHVTIKHVADAAGVSVGTISNYLNGTAKVADETADRIKSAIDSLSYTPNMMASGLRKMNSHIICVLVPNMNNLFYAKACSTLTDIEFKCGYYTFAFSYDYSVEKERKVLLSLFTMMPNYVVVFNGYNDDEELSKLYKSGAKIILADRKSDNKNYYSISYDNRNAIDEVVSMLKAKKYKRIGLITEPSFFNNIAERREGFENALLNNGYTYRKEDVYSRKDLCLNNIENGYKYMNSILNKKRKEDLPDALVVTSDLLAIGVIRALNEAGWSVPGDCGIVSFDNTEMADFTVPRLTAVSQDQVLLGQSIWKIINEIDAAKKEINNIVLPQRLIMRESC